MQALRIVLKVILWGVPLFLLASVLRVPLLFLDAEPVTAKLLEVRVIQERNSGYNGRGGRGSLRPVVSFEYVLPQGGVALGQCFSTIESAASQSDFNARVEHLERRVGQSVPAYRSSVDGSACLFRDHPWKDVALSIVLLGIAAALAHSPVSPLNRAGRKSASTVRREQGPPGA